MSAVEVHQSPLEIVPAGRPSSGAEVDVKFAAANQAFGNPIGGTKKLEVTFLLRFSDYSYFGPVTVFTSVEVGANETKTVRIPAKDAEQTFVFWKEVVGTVTVNRATSVSTNERTMSPRPSDIQVGWGLTILEGIAYERAEASMYRFS